mgnify:CR=1 FL=1
MKHWNLLPMLVIAFTTFNSFASYPDIKFKQLNNFGENPGELSASYLTKNSSVKNLIVLLHGCGQNGQTFAKYSGFVEQVNKFDMALLVPQQIKSNNVTTCFNWFSKQDQTITSGEFNSIVNMITATVNKLSIEDVYVVGFSAGAAMASNLMTQLPQTFKAGALVAGIPYPCADNLIKAISCMKSGSGITGQALAKKVMRSNKRWPDLIVVTGTEDTIVNPKNSLQMAEQWAYLTNSAGNKRKTIEEGVIINTWGGNKIEQIRIPNLGHAFPIVPDLDDGKEAAPFILKTSFSIVDYVSNRWFN